MTPLPQELKEGRGAFAEYQTNFTKEVEDDPNN